ncbi:MAG: DUF1592 domain-containing protein [Planctomycetota bacterium]
MNQTLAPTIGRFWLAAFLLLAAPVLALNLAPALALAQESDEEFENEFIEEIDEQLEDAKDELKYLKRRTTQIEQRVSILTEMRRLHLGIRELEEKLEIAEEQDPDAVESIERRITLGEISIGQMEDRLSFQNLYQELAELIDELDVPKLAASRRLLVEMLKEVSETQKFIERQYATLLKDAEAEEAWEAIEARREALEPRLEHRMEVARLRLDLYWAEEEGEEERVEELEKELRQIERVRERARSIEDDEPIEPDAASMPIELTDEDFRIAKSLDYQQDVVAGLMRFCGDCHSGSGSSGDLDLDKIANVQPLVVNREHWLNIVQQIKVRSMPPEDSEMPTDTERRHIAAWLTHAIEDFDYQTVRRVGYEPARRLTRDEYNNTIRDLVGIDIRPADRFPADLTATSGFRNSANSLFFQPITLERFVGAAELVVDEAFPLEDPSAEQAKSWDRLLGSDESMDRPQEIIRSFASRAFRRPVDPAELTQLNQHFESRITKGANRREAMRDVLKVVLVSPAFLFRSESYSESKTVSDYELATRLSYFLWASMPDDELFQLAAENRLSDPAVLRSQVDRMLNHPRSRTLGTLFAAQWFGTDQLDRIRPDQIEHPWATDGLVSAMKAETALLFETLVREDLPLERLVDADFTFVNEELARHYGLDDVQGEVMQRVSLNQSARRGLLGHASVLAVTSFPGRASPVLRGNWILSHLLGTPPPPPPPNVSQFDERVAESERLTQRQKLQLHRSNPNCYGCHSQIDPLGFSLAEFDWYGRQRNRRGGRRVDSQGQLPDGTVVNGLLGLTDILTSARIDDLSRQATTKLFTYALGRQLEYYDESTVRELLENFENNDRRIRSLIHGIVQTDTFQSNDFQENPE